MRRIECAAERERAAHAQEEIDESNRKRAPD
jgi:hypothetical protein